MKRTHVHFLRVLALFFLLFIICVLQFNAAFCTGEQDDAFLKLSNAQNSFYQAYATVLEAAKAGSNISSVLARLENAGYHLAKSEIGYRLGNFSGTVDEAGLSSGLLEDVANEASGLKSAALANAQQSFQMTVTLSLAAASAIIVLLFLFWRRSKRYYSRRTLYMKPEAVDISR